MSEKALEYSKLGTFFNTVYKNFNSMAIKYLHQAWSNKSCHAFGREYFILVLKRILFPLEQFRLTAKEIAELLGVTINICQIRERYFEQFRQARFAELLNFNFVNLLIYLKTPYEEVKAILLP